MDHRDGAVRAVDGAEERECDGVIAPKSDYSRQCLAILCGTLLFGVGSWGSGEDTIVAFFDLVERPCVVISRAWSASEAPIETSRLTM